MISIVHPQIGANGTVSGIISLDTQWPRHPRRHQCDSQLYTFSSILVVPLWWCVLPWAVIIVIGPLGWVVGWHPGPWHQWAAAEPGGMRDIGMVYRRSYWKWIMTVITCLYIRGLVQNCGVSKWIYWRYCSFALSLGCQNAHGILCFFSVGNHMNCFD